MEQLETLELDIATTKIALESWRRCRRESKRPKAVGAWKSWFTIPRLSLASGAAARGLWSNSPFRPHDIALTAYRGTETAIVSEWRPLHMHLNAAD